MAKKHYKIIVQVLKEAKGMSMTYEQLIQEMASALEQDNAAFNKDKFLEAINN